MRIFSRGKLASAAAIAVFGAAGLVLAPAPMAHASVNDPIDVGVTILQHGYWKGSGSYSNYHNSFGQVCVRLYLSVDFWPWQFHTVRCVTTPPGGGYAFSAPDMACGNSYDQYCYVYTEVDGYDHSGNQIISKLSNSIAAHC